MQELFIAIENNDFAKVKEFIESALDISDISDEFSGATPLHMAVGYGYRQITEFLLEKGSDVNSVDNVGNTPLHFAAAFPELKDTRSVISIGKLLIEKGAKLNAKNNEGDTPLHFAFNKEGKIGIIELLIKYGAKVNTENRMGLTPVQKSRGYTDDTPEKEKCFCYKYCLHAK
ncbi:MAG: ankyrin repeat domain-containing protein [Spirochaetota bacterium]|nr:ankyrin repeat domain-containing protein [Spirochaetota bacterium]